MATPPARALAIAADAINRGAARFRSSPRI